MNIEGLSTSSLLMLHSVVRQALVTDDDLPEGATKIHEVREYPDWKQWSDRIENVLDNRRVKYERIKW